MNNQVKIFLWCVPRSCSTAFSKAISQQENSKIVMEPFSEAYYHGEEQISQRYLDSPPKPNLTFSDIQKSLENDYNDFSVVFAKDMGYYLINHLDRLNEVLPEGYQHTFLIRNPRKTVASLYKATNSKNTEGFTYYDPAEGEFKTLHDLFFKLKEQTGKTPLLVDAADLIEKPDQVLNTYCKETGLPFSEEMLKWDKGGMASLEAQYPGWQATLTQSTGFTKPPSPSPKEQIQISDEAQQTIDDSMPYYNALYQYRMAV